MLAARARPVGQHAFVMGDLEARVDCTFLYCKCLVAGRRRVEPDVEDGLVEVGLNSACASKGTREVRAWKVPRGSLPAVRHKVLARRGRVGLVTVRTGCDQLRPDVGVAHPGDQARLARFQQAQPLMVIRPNLSATPHWHLVSWSCRHYSVTS